MVGNYCVEFASGGRRLLVDGAYQHSEVVEGRIARGMKDKCSETHIDALIILAAWLGRPVMPLCYGVVVQHSLPQEQMAHEEISSLHASS